MTAVAKRVREDADRGLIRAVAQEPVLSVTGISAYSVREYWTRIEPFLARLADADYSVASLRALLEQRKLQLWLCREGHEVKGVLVTELCSRPLTKVCILRGFAADGFRNWLPYLSLIEDWARAKGCATIEIVGRNGWERVFLDWTKTHTVLSKEL